MGRVIWITESETGNMQDCQSHRLLKYSSMRMGYAKNLTCKVIDLQDKETCARVLATQLVR